jgi:hypothetical membrane protein
MTFTSYLFGILSAALILVVVVELLRRRHLRERHAVWWFVAGVVALVVGIFPASLEWAANAIAVLFLVCLQHSSELTQLESKTRTLAERLALLELKLNETGEQLPPRSEEK